jgi:hypothetical protein
MGARREVLSAVVERYRSAGRVEKGRVLDALCRTTGWHRKHAVRALRRRVIDTAVETEAPARASAPLRRNNQGRSDGPVGGVGSCVRQAARGDDPEPCAWRNTADCSSAEASGRNLLTVSAATIDRMLDPPTAPLHVPTFNLDLSANVSQPTQPPAW